MLDVAPIWTPAYQQSTFRVILEAMSRPGRVQTIVQEQGSEPLHAVLATLLDGTVSLADPNKLLADDIWPLLQARPADIEQADFIVCDGSSVFSLTPKLGDLDSPEKSATLMIKVASLTQGDVSACLTGPGVNGHQAVSLSGFDVEWFKLREDWVCEFPLGVDLLLLDEQGVMAIPRTSKVEVK